MTYPDGGGGTRLGTAVRRAIEWYPDYERMIVLTDEQSHYDPIPELIGGKQRHYLINITSYDRTVNHGQWTQINGFSEAVLQYIRVVEESK